MTARINICEPPHRSQLAPIEPKRSAGESGTVNCESGNVGLQNRLILNPSPKEKDLHLLCALDTPLLWGGAGGEAFLSRLFNRCNVERKQERIFADDRD